METVRTQTHVKIVVQKEYVIM